MEAVPYVVTYVAVGVFVLVVIARFLMWTRMPLHMRWELYPVAHEGKRARYGGSYLEEVDWWRKPRERSLAGEVKAMGMEILFLVALREHNRRLWLVSFPFHFGLYLIIGATALMVLSGILAAVSPGLVAGGFGSVVRLVVVACGFGGVGLGLFGALGLLWRRLTDPDLKDFTSPADIFNLVLFVVVFGLALAHAVLIDPGFTRALSFVQNLLTLKMVALAGTSTEVLLTSVVICLLGLLAAYIPLTHMSHFVGKYFAYHAIRWNDDPNLPGSEHEESINDVLQYPVSWAATHINGDGKKTWGEVATDITSAQESGK